MATWYSADTPQSEERWLEAWGGIDAPTGELGRFITEVAKEDVIAYAPTPLTEEDAAELENTPPSRYVMAQLQQAKNLWNAGRAQQDGQVGTEGYNFTPRPLDKTLRALIRPKTGVPNVF